MDSQKIFEMLQIAYAECGEHCFRVAQLAEEFCGFLQLDTEMIATIKQAALFHDVGKLSIPECILDKPTKLSDTEWETMKKHVIFSAEFLGGAGFSDEICDIVRHHHERWDGHGYVDGLSGTNIPYGARIIALCDSFDAMHNARCYRKEPFTTESCLEEIARNAGIMYDPELTDAFLAFYTSECS